MNPINAQATAAFFYQDKLQHDFPNEITSKLNNESEELLHTDRESLKTFDDEPEVVADAIKRPLPDRKRV